MQSVENSKKKFKILSLDGGGLRAVVPLQILKYIEKVTGKKIHECFDLIAGTSTGGILACALTLPDRDSEFGRNRKYSVERIEQLYLKHGKNIFRKPKYKIIRFLKKKIKNRIRPEFDPKYLDKLLRRYFQNARIADSLVPIFVTSFDIHRNIPVYFSSREGSLLGEKNAKLIDICRATSAAPTYFPAYTFTYNDETVSCIDGGVFMNNPALGAIVEVLNNHTDKHYGIGGIKDFNDIMVLSLGTGVSDGLLDERKAKKWGEIGWARPAIDLTMNSPIKALDNQINTIYKLFGASYNYARMNITIAKSSSEMSDSKNITMNYLKDEVQSQLFDNKTHMLNLEIFLREAGLIS